MGSHIMSAHIMNKTLLMEFLQSARKKKIIKAADRKFKLEKFILGKKKCHIYNWKSYLLFGMITEERLWKVLYW